MAEAEELELVYSPETIAVRVSRIAAEIDSLYAGRPLLAVCVLKGAFIFFADLVRKMTNPLLELDFISLSSYGSDTVSSGKVVPGRKLASDITGRDILIVEDIVDSGLTMQFLLAELQKGSPASLRIAALLDKVERRETDIDISFSCFKTGAGFFVGYGLDYRERFRSLPGIWQLKGQC